MREIPSRFISRYRKEATGALNDEQLRDLGERLTYLRNLEDKKAQVISSIEEQGKLTRRAQRQRSRQRRPQVAVDDLYRTISSETPDPCGLWQKEKGLEGLANIILLQMTTTPLEIEAEKLSV